MHWLKKYNTCTCYKLCIFICKRCRHKQWLNEVAVYNVEAIQTCTGETSWQFLHKIKKYKWGLGWNGLVVVVGLDFFWSRVQTPG